MLRRLVFVIVLLLPCVHASRSAAQDPDQPPPAPPVIESPGPIPEVPEHTRSLEFGLPDLQDAVAAVGELRAAVRTSPRSAEDRAKLAQALYRLGDLDAAIEESRLAIRLQPDDARAHVQLAVMLMAKQDWRAAASLLKEAVRLNPGLAHAHYSLGAVQYSLGNVKAAIQSYREALNLQPYFPDARYRLALLLKLSGQERDAAQFMEEAAIGGVPQAQLFLGNAYKSGQEVEKRPDLAIFWWTKAAELGQQAAADALSKLRRQALAAETSERRKAELLKAFERYRERLWEEFPAYSWTNGDESLGVLLRKDDRRDAALAVLFAEAYALSETAQTELGALYEAGWDPYLAPFDKKILACLETTAAEGFGPAKKILARIYAKGLGVEPNPAKAKAVLKGLPKPDLKSTLESLGLS